MNGYFYYYRRRNGRRKTELLRSQQLCRIVLVRLFWIMMMVVLFAAAAAAAAAGMTGEDSNEEEGSSHASSTGSSSSSSSSSESFTTSISDRVKLNDGNSIPVVGLGVALTAESTYDAVQYAMSVGYRLIDTAAEESYGNEDQVGQAIRDYNTNNTTASSSSSSSTNNISRETMFVTTKLWDSDHGFYPTLQAFDLSYDTLDIERIDLYLMHSPFGGRLLETWDAMVLIQQRGYVKSIGVSNFGIQHLQILLESGRPLPAVNQIEMHPLVYTYRLPLIQWCREHNIQIQAYGSILHGYDDLITMDVLVTMASKYKKTTAQLLLRWALQHDFLIIPKSTRKERILENSQLYDFTISEDDMELLDHLGDDDDDIQMNKKNLYKRDWNWNPIDEAPVHLGYTHYWPNYTNVQYDEDDDDDENNNEEL